MKKILLLPSFELNKEQLEDLSSRYSEDGIKPSIVLLKTQNKDLHNRVAHCPIKSEQLYSLADELATECSTFDIVVGPVGTPALLFAFGIKASQHEFQVLFPQGVTYHKHLEFTEL